MTKRSQGLLFACVTALCWSVLAILLKKALAFSDSAAIVAFRMIFAFFALGLFFLFFKTQEIKKLSQCIPLLALCAGLLLAFNYYGFMKGIELTGAGNTQVMIQSGPTLLILSGLLFFKERFGFSQILGLFMALLGFYLFYVDKKSFDIEASLELGNSWILTGAAAWATYASLQKHLSLKWDPQTLNLVVYGVCAISLSLNADLSSSLNYTFWQWLLMVLLGANTFVAYGCFAEALKYAPASQVSLIITLNPLLTLIILDLGEVFNIFWIPQESLSWLGWLGALMVVMGVTWTLSQHHKIKS